MRGSHRGRDRETGRLRPGGRERCRSGSRQIRRRRGQGNRTTSSLSCREWTHTRSPLTTGPEYPPPTCRFQTVFSCSGSGATRAGPATDPFAWGPRHCGHSADSGGERTKTPQQTRDATKRRSTAQKTVVPRSDRRMVGLPSKEVGLLRGYLRWCWLGKRLNLTCRLRAEMGRVAGASFYWPVEMRRERPGRADTERRGACIDPAQPRNRYRDRPSARADERSCSTFMAVEVRTIHQESCQTDGFLS